MRKPDLFPASLTAQMVTVILAAILIAQLLTAWILFDAHRTNMYSSAQWQLVKRSGYLAKQLNHAPSIFHPNMVQAASIPRAQFTINTLPLLDTHRSRPLQSLLVKRVEHNLGPEFRGRIRIQMGRYDWRGNRVDQCATDDLGRPLDAQACSRRSNYRNRPDTGFVVMSVRLQNNSWLNLAAQAPLAEPLAARQTVLFLLIASLLVLLAIVFMVRRITRPLRALSVASNSLGRGDHVDPLPETGPEDLRRATRAFNLMNERINRFVADRTKMLAALTHDLRTPITTLRLRIELQPESPDKQRLLSTLDEMQQMAEATLSFAQDNAVREPSRRVDLNALIDSLCEDLKDIGMAVSFSEGPEIISSCRNVSLRRALRNLIENAVKYGQSATVSLTATRQNAIITINDEGPGMSAADMERVFEPFVRLESSRNRETGGIGLGMSIARNIIHAHGGEITLKNRKKRGLSIRVLLPR